MIHRVGKAVDAEVVALLAPGRLIDGIGLGESLVVDDFGTGYSSLRYLRRFPIAILKINRSFVEGLGIDRNDETLVKAVIGLARALGIVVVSKAVETALQDSHLIELGCALAQGFHYGGVLDPSP